MFNSVKTIRNGITPSLYTELRDHDAPNVVAHIKLNITDILLGAAKINPPQLKIKQEELCLHSFKCLNCEGNHQADSNICPFWKHRFNNK